MKALKLPAPKQKRDIGYDVNVFVEATDSLFETIAHELGHNFGINSALASGDDHVGHSNQRIDLMYPNSVRGLEQTNIRKHQWRRTNEYVRLSKKGGKQ